MKKSTGTCRGISWPDPATFPNRGRFRVHECRGLFLRFRFRASGFRVSGFRFRALGLQGLRFRGLGLGFIGFQGLGFT